MSNIAECKSCQPEPVTVSVPGPQGSPGTPNFTKTVAPFAIPATTSSVAILIESNLSFVVGQIVSVGGANFIITQLTGASAMFLQPLGFPADTVEGSTIQSGTMLVAGISNLTIPIPVPMGGTGVTTLSDLMIALGLTGFTLPVSEANGGTGLTSLAAVKTALNLDGFSPTVANGTAIYGTPGVNNTNAFTITTAMAQVAFNTNSPVITFAAAGTYLVQARCRADYNAATFAGSVLKTLTAKIRRTTPNATDLISVAFGFVPLTAAQNGTIGELAFPPLTYVAAVNDAIALFAGLDSADVINSGGKLLITEASIVAQRLF